MNLTTTLTSASPSDGSAGLFPIAGPAITLPSNVGGAGGEPTFDAIFCGLAIDLSVEGERTTGDATGSPVEPGNEPNSALFPAGPGGAPALPAAHTRPVRGAAELEARAPFPGIGSKSTSLALRPGLGGTQAFMSRPTVPSGVEDAGVPSDLRPEDDVGAMSEEFDPKQTKEETVDAGTFTLPPASVPDCPLDAYFEERMSQIRPTPTAESARPGEIPAGARNEGRDVSAPSASRHEGTALREPVAGITATDPLSVTRRHEGRRVYESSILGGVVSQETNPDAVAPFGAVAATEFEIEPGRPALSLPAAENPRFHAEKDPAVRPPANFALSQTDALPSDQGAKNPQRKEMQIAEALNVSGVASEVGTTIAKRPAVMSSAFASHAAVPANSSIGEMVAASAQAASIERTGEPPTPVSIPEAAVGTAHRAVETVLATAERYAVSHRAVNFRFSVGGSDLSVRVEMRDNEVCATFRTDSSDLRAALAQEWQAIHALPSDRTLRFATPVFTESLAAGSGSSGGESSQPREHGSRTPVAEDFATFAGRGGSAAPARSSDRADHHFASPHPTTGRLYARA